MKVITLELPGVKIIEPTVYADYRGYYKESYSARALQEYGINTVFVQDNHSRTLKKGTIRGIHFQNNPKPQIKLVRCTRGAVLDVVVDLRRDSPTFKEWLAIELSEDNNKQILIPSGFGHGFMTLVDDCEVLYKVDEFYEPQYDRAIAWNDPEININWQIEYPIISDKDRKAPLLSASDVNFTINVNRTI